MVVVTWTLFGGDGDCGPEGWSLPPKVTLQGMKVALEPSALPLAASRSGVVCGFGTGGPHHVSSEHRSTWVTSPGQPLGCTWASFLKGWLAHFGTHFGPPWSSVFSASRFNSRACWRWVMCLDLGSENQCLCHYHGHMLKSLFLHRFCW